MKIITELEQNIINSTYTAKYLKEVIYEYMDEKRNSFNRNRTYYQVLKNKADKRTKKYRDYIALESEYEGKSSCATYLCAMLDSYEHFEELFEVIAEEEEIKIAAINCLTPNLRLFRVNSMSYRKELSNVEYAKGYLAFISELQDFSETFLN